jgi:hypothetical protein
MLQLQLYHKKENLIMKLRLNSLSSDERADMQEGNMIITRFSSFAN